MNNNIVTSESGRAGASGIRASTNPNEEGIGSQGDRGARDVGTQQQKFDDNWFDFYRRIDGAQWDELEGEDLQDVCDMTQLVRDELKKSTEAGGGSGVNVAEIRQRLKYCLRVRGKALQAAKNKQDRAGRQEDSDNVTSDSEVSLSNSGSEPTSSVCSASSGGSSKKKKNLGKDAYKGGKSAKKAWLVRAGENEMKSQVAGAKDAWLERKKDLKPLDVSDNRDSGKRPEKTKEEKQSDRRLNSSYNVKRLRDIVPGYIIEYKEGWLMTEEFVMYTRFAMYILFVYVLLAGFWYAGDGGVVVIRHDGYCITEDVYIDEHLNYVDDKRAEVHEFYRWLYNDGNGYNVTDHHRFSFSNGTIMWEMEAIRLPTWYLYRLAFNIINLRAELTKKLLSWVGPALWQLGFYKRATTCVPEYYTYEDSWTWYCVLLAGFSLSLALLWTLTVSLVLWLNTKYHLYTVEEVRRYAKETSLDVWGETTEPDRRVDSNATIDWVHDDPVMLVVRYDYFRAGFRRHQNLYVSGELFVQATHPKALSHTQTEEDVAKRMTHTVDDNMSINIDKYNAKFQQQVELRDVFNATKRMAWGFYKESKQNMKVPFLDVPVVREDVSFYMDIGLVRYLFPHWLKSSKERRYALLTPFEHMIQQFGDLLRSLLDLIMWVRPAFILILIILFLCWQVFRSGLLSNHLRLSLDFTMILVNLCLGKFRNGLFLLQQITS